MAKVIKILKPGLLTTVQDSGRHGFQKFGMPVCGAMDYFSFRIGNLLAGNDENAPALEITMTGPTLEILADCVISICGADISPMIDEKPFPMWFSKHAAKGQVISFGKLKTGARAYICVSGGIKADSVLGSCSTYIAGHLGGFAGRPLAAGDELEADLPLKLKAGFGIGRINVPAYDWTEPVYVIPGPDFKSFTDGGIRTFFNSEYMISNKSNRMGYRLEGCVIEHREKADIISSAVNIGTIQVPMNGNPIILMSDRQTTGGYARIGNVILSDIPKIAQRLPGQTIRFEKITIDEAQDRYRQDMNLISRIKAYIR